MQKDGSAWEPSFFILLFLFCFCPAFPSPVAAAGDEWINVDQQGGISSFTRMNFILFGGTQREGKEQTQY